jgi:hypothetical protein
MHTRLSSALDRRTGEQSAVAGLFRKFLCYSCAANADPRLVHMGLLGV